MPSFQNPDGSAFNESGGGPVRTVTDPTSASTVAIRANERALYIDLSSTLAALTVLLPLGVQDGERAEIGANGTVTALTIHDGFGAAITGAPTTIAAGAAIVMRRVAGVWVHWK